MKLLNVITYGMGGMLCAALVSGCSDDRGTHGFKAYQYSKEQRAENKALLDAKNGTTPGPQATNTPTDDSAGSGEVGLGTSKALLEHPERPSKFADSAQPKLFDGPNPSQVAQLQSEKTIKDLVVDIESEYSTKKINAVAKSLVKGITVQPNSLTNPTAFTIQAMVSIGGKDMLMDAADVPVKFLKDDEHLPNFSFELIKPCTTSSVAVKNSLQAAAWCRDEKCNAIQIILSFERENNLRADAYLLIAPGINPETKAPEWQFQRSNIETPKTFVQVQPVCKPEGEQPPKPGATEGPKVGQAGEDGPKGSDGPGAGPSAEELEQQKKAKAEREAADAKWCEEVKKEGFSCSDSREKIAQLREEARKAKLKSATPPDINLVKACLQAQSVGVDCGKTYDAESLKKAQEMLNEEAKRAKEARAQGDGKKGGQPEQDQQDTAMPDINEVKACLQVESLGVHCGKTYDAESIKKAQQLLDAEAQRNKDLRERSKVKKNDINLHPPVREPKRQA